MPFIRPIIGSGGIPVEMTGDEHCVGFKGEGGPSGLNQSVRWSMIDDRSGNSRWMASIIWAIIEPMIVATAMAVRPITNSSRSKGHSKIHSVRCPLSRCGPFPSPYAMWPNTCKHNIVDYQQNTKWFFPLSLQHVSRFDIKHITMVAGKTEMVITTGHYRDHTQTFSNSKETLWQISFIADYNFRR